MDSAEHRVEMYNLARNRIDRGLPVWEEIIDVSSFFHDESKSFLERRDLIVESIKLSKWYIKSCEEIEECVSLLADSENEEEFNDQWNELYNIADYARVFIKT